VGTFWERSGQGVPTRGIHRDRHIFDGVVMTDDMRNERNIFDEVLMTDCHAVCAVNI